MVRADVQAPDVSRASPAQSPAELPDGLRELGGCWNSAWLTGCVGWAGGEQGRGGTPKKCGRALLGAPQSQPASRLSSAVVANANEADSNATGAPGGRIGHKTPRRPVPRSRRLPLRSMHVAARRQQPERPRRQRGAAFDRALSPRRAAGPQRSPPAPTAPQTRVEGCAGPSGVRGRTFAAGRLGWLRRPVVKAWKGEGRGDKKRRLLCASVEWRCCLPKGPKSSKSSHICTSANDAGPFWTLLLALDALHPFSNPTGSSTTRTVSVLHMIVAPTPPCASLAPFASPRLALPPITRHQARPQAPALLTQTPAAAATRQQRRRLARPGRASCRRLVAANAAADDGTGAWQGMRSGRFSCSSPLQNTHGRARLAFPFGNT